MKIFALGRGRLKIRKPPITAARQTQNRTADPVSAKDAKIRA
jgi:hypothetical protein